MEQVAGQFAERQFHAALGLGKARLRSERGHGGAGEAAVLGSDQFLHQRRQHRVEAILALEPFGQLPFERERMAMGKQRRTAEEMFRQGFAMAIGKRLTSTLPARFGLRTQNLPGEVVTHAADARDQLVAEQRMIRCSEQMREDRPDPRKRGIPARKRLAQALLPGGGFGGYSVRHRQGSRISSTWLSAG